MPPRPTSRPTAPIRCPTWPTPVADDEITRPVESGARTFGHSKDFRTDLPQVVIAMAVTRDGIPVRCWTFPGNTADTAIIRTITDDLDGWRNLAHELDRMHLVTLATDHGTVAQRSARTAGQRKILTALELPEPPRFCDFTTTDA